MRIHREDQIDRNKLTALFKSRGHGIEAADNVQFAYDVLDGKIKGYGVFQCKCGELFFMHDDFPKIIAGLIEVDVENLPCKVCGGYKSLTVDRTLVNALEDLKSDPQKSSSGSRVVERDLLLGLIPDNTPVEFEAGLYELSKAMEENFPVQRSQIERRILTIASAARKRNPIGFQTYFASILNHKDFVNETTNALKAYQIVRSIREEKVRKRLLGEPIDSSDPTEYVALHSAYLEIVEAKEHLNMLENLRRLSTGLAPVSNPFQHSNSARGGGRSVNSLATMISHLASQVPNLHIDTVFNSRLRNAKGHNQYRINAKKEQIVLTKYHETISFSKLDRMTRNALKLVVTLSNIAASSRVAVPGAATMSGILDISLRYKEQQVHGGIIRPVGNSPAELTVLQSWAFSDTKVDDILDFHMSKRNGELGISLVRGAKSFYWPLNSEVARWLSQIAKAHKVNIRVLSVAPPLPSFLPTTKFMIPIDHHQNEIYVQESTQIELAVSSKILASVSRILGTTGAFA